MATTTPTLFSLNIFCKALIIYKTNDKIFLRIYLISP